MIFTGFLEDDDLWHALSALDICVLPFEFPLEERSSGPLRQVIDRGLPTIVTARDKNYTEYGFKHGENIWLTPLGNVETLRIDIQKLLRDPALRKKLSQGAQDLRPVFGYDAVSNEMSRLYAKLLG